MRCFRCDNPIQEHAGSYIGPNETTRCPGTALRHSPFPEGPAAPRRAPVGLKAKLIVRVLAQQQGQADAVVVAESTDPGLWQRTLAAIGAEAPEPEHSLDARSCARCTGELGVHTGCKLAKETDGPGPGEAG